MEERELSQANMRKMVRKHLRKIEISEESKGFQYLEESILLSLSDEEVQKNITEKIYSKVAQKFDTRVNRMSTFMGMAIKEAYEKRYDSEVWTTYFGNSVNWKIPKNKEFIMAIRERIVPKSAIEKKVEKHLKILGISMGNYGYNYLKAFIIALLKEDDQDLIFEKNLIKVAKTFDIAPSSLYNRIDQTIKESVTSFSYGEWPNYYLGNSIKKYCQRVPNAELICIIRERIALEGKTNIEKLVAKHLFEIGVPVDMNGYYYLKKAIVILLEDYFKKRTDKKSVYKRLAEEFGKDPKKINRELYRTITETYSKEYNAKILKEYFGDGKPTATQFIREVKKRIVKERKITNCN